MVAQVPMPNLVPTENPTESLENSISQDLITEAWTAISWDDFVQLVEQPECDRYKAYYYNQKMRLEPMSTGSDHSQEHAILIFLVGLYAMLKPINISPRDNCSFRKPGIAEFQPDIAYYIGETVNQIPKGTRIINLEQYPLPDLVIEVADTSFKDDIGAKRLLYEELGISEYWVWNVQTGKILAFSIGSDWSSRRIRVSEVLPGLDLDLIEAAIQRSWESDQSTIGQWLMQQWQESDSSSLG